MKFPRLGLSKQMYICKCKLDWEQTGTRPEPECHLECHPKCHPKCHPECHPEYHPECHLECHPECQDQEDMVRSHTVMV